MKANKMTNEQLARNLEATIPFLMAAARHQTDADDILREAAKRLRRPSPVDDDLLKMARDIDALRAKLKVAEDALTECRGFAERYETDDDYMQSDICSDIRGTVHTALAAIRESVTDCNLLKGATNGRQ